MYGKDLERADRIVSTLAALGTFGFFFAVVAYGWYQAFIAMAAARTRSTASCRSVDEASSPPLVLRRSFSSVMSCAFVLRWSCMGVTRPSAA